jgi:DNA-binding FrmR family transcriptional regulator
VRIDRHAADRVDDAAFGRRAMVLVVLMIVAGVIVPMLVMDAHARPLAADTLGGYVNLMPRHSKTSKKESTLKRLSRIEGQVRGLARMVESERYCIDIVTQLGAVRAALRRVEEEILRDHVAHCVEHAITSGDKADQRRKVAELMDVMGRAGR